MTRLPRKPMLNFTKSSGSLLYGTPTAARAQRIAVSTSCDRELASPTLSFRSRIAHFADRAPISTWENRAKASEGSAGIFHEELWLREARRGVASATWAGAHTFARAHFYI